MSKWLTPLLACLPLLWCASSAGQTSGPAQPEPLPGSHEVVLRNAGYTVGYDTERRCPAWAAWTLAPEHTAETYSRKDAGGFREDTRLAGQGAKPGDYRNTGWTRGHLCPSGDNRWNLQWLRDSYLMSNICPQAAKLNSGVWNQIERTCREWARRHGELDIVSGPIYYRQPTHAPITTPAGTRVAVPDAFFKVVASRRDGLAIGFICRNSDEVATEPVNGRRKQELYVHTVREVERIVGRRLLPELDETVASRADFGAW